VHVDKNILDPMLLNAKERLLAARTPSGYWEGELASSALSTATAAFALTLVGKEIAQPHDDAIQRGMAWLLHSQNCDGGWGDTPNSLSNISTTALAWATLVLQSCDTPNETPRRRAEGYLRRAAGSLDPEDLARAIAARYGKDRTFSTPILSMLTLGGCLDSEESPWRHVVPLPFELAACPDAWFRWLRLPVVSYALPALIALGYLRHKKRPSRFPAVRLMRSLVSPRVLRKLMKLQPSSGGFLEAIPLTSFVVMSLAASGGGDHPVVHSGLDFLKRSQRADGSWPIDSNLATWVTTLSVNALASDAEGWRQIAPNEKASLLQWLLHQQHRHEHPYTRAAPGGWAWTDLPGAVPDADDTAGALLALSRLNGGGEQSIRTAAAQGITWLLNLQNRDGGMPTFCRGWGALPFDRSSPDLTAHSMRALRAWRGSLSSKLCRRMDKALQRMAGYLLQKQRPDGAWAPLWFGNQHAAGEENLTYGTSRVLLANSSVPSERRTPAWQTAMQRGLQWLLLAQNDDGGWGSGPGTPSSIEETSLVMEAIADFQIGLGRVPAFSPDAPWSAALWKGVAWLNQQTDQGSRFPPAPIGLYFAKLWYHERLYPLVYSIAALNATKAALCATSSSALARNGMVMT
jgi:squalene-hopene/tetraprenyl-beta-curcumene cyclase